MYKAEDYFNSSPQLDAQTSLSDGVTPIPAPLLVVLEAKLPYQFKNQLNTRLWSHENFARLEATFLCVSRFITPIAMPRQSYVQKSQQLVVKEAILKDMVGGWKQVQKRIEEEANAAAREGGGGRERAGVYAITVDPNTCHRTSDEGVTRKGGACHFPRAIDKDAPAFEGTPLPTCPRYHYPLTTAGLRRHPGDAAGPGAPAVGADLPQDVRHRRLVDGGDQGVLVGAANHCQPLTLAASSPLLSALCSLLAAF
jgi:hypothetical protein